MEKVNRYYCQKVLPLAYDESLSYYEVLCKLTKAMNDVIESINNDFADIVKEGVEKHFNEIMVNAIYDESDECITLEAEIVGDGLHKFDPDTKTISII